MSKVCNITNKKPLVGNNVSKSNIKTKRRQLPNLQVKRIFVPELKRYVKLKISTSAMKSIDKLGLLQLTKSTIDTKDKIKWEDGKEYPLYKLDISSQSHPYFTGEQNLVDTAGRIEKYLKKYNMTNTESSKKDN